MLMNTANFTLPCKGGSSGTTPPTGGASWTSFAMQGQPTLLTAGQTIAAGNHNFEWTFLNPGNIVAASIEVLDVTAGNVVIETAVPISSPQSVNIGTSKTGGIGTFQEWSALAIDNNGDTFTTSQYGSENFIVTWGGDLYFGSSANPAEDEAGLEAMNSILAIDFPGNYQTPASGFKYISIPVSLGTPSIFTDTNTGFNIAMEAPYTVSFTNTFGDTSNYNVYRSTNQMEASISIKVS